MKQRWLLNPVVHLAADALRFVGMRDRLRCPHCRAVGTFKPHGGRLDGEDLRHVPRWLCKWCGLYLGPEGRMWCVVDTELGVWREPQAVPGGTTPERVVRRELGGTSPWRG